MHLMEHQKKAIDVFKRENELALFWDMGTGKTAAAVRMCLQEGLKPTLILSPLITLQNWRREIKLWGEVRPDLITVSNKTGGARVKELRQAIENSGRRFIILNYEALGSGDLFNLLLDWRPEVIVCDEGHLLKSPQSKRAKMVVQLGDRARRRILLTGTPILNSALDIWNQYRFLDKGELLGANFFKFRNEYFYDRNYTRKGLPGYFPDFQPRPKSFERLNSLIYTKALRVKKEECLELPPLLEPDPIEVGMLPDQKRMYLSMRDDYLAEIADAKTKQTHKVVAEIALTKALRLQQIVSGFYKTDEGEEFCFDKCPRLQATEELVDQIIPNGKLIIWAVFQSNYRMLTEMLERKGITYRGIFGGMKQRDRDQSMLDFEEDDSVRVIVANPKAGGVGVNLVAASYSIVYSRGFSLTDELQSLARNYRKGSERHLKITRYNLMTPGTIDELVVRALLDKQNISDRILEWKL